MRTKCSRDTGLWPVRAVRAWARGPCHGGAVIPFLFLILCVGCTSHARADATTKPVQSIATLKLSDAVDLDDLTKDAEPNLSHQLRLSRGGRIYFGTIN